MHGIFSRTGRVAATLITTSGLVFVALLGGARSAHADVPRCDPGTVGVSTVGNTPVSFTLACSVSSGAPLTYTVDPMFLRGIAVPYGEAITGSGPNFTYTPPTYAGSSTTDAGNVFHMPVVVSDGSSQTTASVTVTVTAPPRPVCTVPSLDAQHELDVYTAVLSLPGASDSAQLSCTDPTGASLTYSVDVTSGDPDAATVSSTGLVTFKPQHAGELRGASLSVTAAGRYPSEPVTFLVREFPTLPPTPLGGSVPVQPIDVVEKVGLAPVTVPCAAACHIEVEATLSGAQAVKLRLAKTAAHPVVIASNEYAKAPVGTTLVGARLTSAAKTALNRAKGTVTVQETITITQRGRTTTKVKTLTLKD